MKIISLLSLLLLTSCQMGKETQAIKFEYDTIPCVKMNTRHEHYENYKMINETYGVDYFYEGNGFSNLEEQYAERPGYFTRDFITDIAEIGTCYTFHGNFEGKVFSKNPL